MSTLAPPVLQVCLVGYGAIGKAIAKQLASHARLRISHVVVRPERVASAQARCWRSPARR